MGSSSRSTQGGSFELYLIWSMQDADREPHWMLMTVPPLSDAQRQGRERTVIKGTRYHSTGGPTEGTAYKPAVQANSNFRSANVRNREYLCNITAQNAAQLARVANSIPAHHCQKYIVCMLAQMERRRMIRGGIAENLARRVQMTQRTLKYEATHPAPVPEGIRLPSSWPLPPKPTSTGPSNTAHGQRPGDVQMTTYGQPSGPTGQIQPKGSGCCVIL